MPWHLSSRACLIDLSIAILALLLANFTLSKSLGNALSILGAFIAIGILLGVVAYQAVSLSTCGQTVGKKIMGLRIVNFHDDSNLGFLKAVLMRWWLPCLIYSIPYLGWAFWLADGLFVFKTERRCVHDLMAGTKVVLLATGVFDTIAV